MPIWTLGLQAASYGELAKQRADPPGLGLTVERCSSRDCCTTLRSSEIAWRRQAALQYEKMILGVLHS